MPGPIIQILQKLQHRCHMYGLLKSEDSLTQAEGPAILPDDVVCVIDDMAEVYRVQTAAKRWDDDMALVSSEQARMCS